jgi:hypothetical protein
VSSIRRPIDRSVRSPRRHTPSKWAGAGSCNRPMATRCGGKSRSGRALRYAVAAPRRSCIRDNSLAVNASWAIVTKMCAHLRGSRAWNPHTEVIVPQFEKYQCLAWQCSKGSMDHEACQSYPFCTPASTESLGVHVGPLPACFRRVGKEPN